MGVWVGRNCGTVVVWCSAEGRAWPVACPYDEYSDWKSVLDRETDDYGTIAKLVTLYRFAIANYSNPLAELLLEAIAAMEAAETEEH